MTTQVTVQDRTVSMPVNGQLADRPVVLEFDDLQKSFGGHQVLQGVSAQLRQGEVVLLRGDNGSGKTTLLNILSGNLEPDKGNIHLKANGSAERFHFPRRWWQELNPFDHFTPERVAWEGVGRTWQDVRLFSTASLADNIAAATPRQTGENPLNALFCPGAVRQMERENQAKSQKILVRLGLIGRNDSSSDRVSLGQTKRVAIARAVQGGAKVLFLDEPLAGLDRQGIEGVMGLLSELVQQHSLTLVIVEHVFNIPRILDLADTVWTLEDGQIAVESPTDVRKQRDECFGVDTVSRIAKALGDDREVICEALPGGASLMRISSQHCEARNPGPPLLELRDLVVRRGKRVVIGWEDASGTVQGLSFSVAHGEIAILQAPNGWGKTTLLEALAGTIPIERGKFCLDGIVMASLPSWERVRQGLAYLRAKSSAFLQLEVCESLRLAGIMENHDLMAKALQTRVVSSLSGGERQKLALACHSRSAKCHLLDEPFSALDAKSLAAWQALTKLQCDVNSGILMALPNTTEF
jgi:branched-chain amino acid transport system ATP-binding protein